MMLVRSCCLGPEYQRRDFGQEGGAHHTRSSLLQPFAMVTASYVQHGVMPKHKTTTTRILYFCIIYKDYSTKLDG